MKRILTLLFTLVFVVSVLPLAVASNTEYIPAPYTLEASPEGPTEYLEPVFYENADGPTIGVTLVGVIKEGDLYFKDSNNNQELDVFEDWRLDTSTRVADLVSKMSTKQRIGLLANQLVAIPAANKTEEAYDEAGNVIFSQLVTPIVVGEVEEDVEGDLATKYRAALKKSMSAKVLLENENRTGVIRKDTDTELGAMFNNALNQVAEYAAVQNSEPNIPYILISNPMLAGYPGPQGFAAAVMGDGNYDLIERFGNLDAKVWDAKGIRQMYGPQIDIITDPRWSRNSGTYTEVPEVMAGIANALVVGYQNGADGVQQGDVALIVKHFPGDGASENGFESHYGIGQLRLYTTEDSMEKYQLPGFQAAVDAKVAGIMPAYSRITKDARSVPQVYRGVSLEDIELGTAYNTAILKTLLKDTMGFTGFINSDSNIITAQFWGVEDMSVPERYAAAINNGCDVVGDGLLRTDYAAITEAVETGLVTPEALDRATSNRMTSAIDMGMFENPYRSGALSKAVYEELAEELNALKTEVNQKSVVLMKNSNGALPLKDTGKKVYIASFTTKGPDEAVETQLKEAFEAAGFTVVKKAAEADIAFLDAVPGGISTSANYMGVIDLVEELEVDQRDFPASQEKTGDTVFVTTLQEIKNIAKVAETVHANGGVVVASINLSSPWVLTNLEPHVDALLGQFGTSVQARVDVITGKVNPTGKLPVTLPASNDVIAVVDTEIDGVVYEVCVSRNDVPGYDKDQYMSEEVLAASPSGSYAYKDADGNLYKAWFGLDY